MAMYIQEIGKILALPQGAAETIPIDSIPPLLRGARGDPSSLLRGARGDPSVAGKKGTK